jgi:hypothetical protein
MGHIDWFFSGAMNSFDVGFPDKISVFDARIVKCYNCLVSDLIDKGGQIMVLIVESIHIISPHVSDAVKERNPQVIQDFSTQQTEAGTDHFAHLRYFKSCNHGSHP